jgi:cytokinin dehydrogenase
MSTSGGLVSIVGAVLDQDRWSFTTSVAVAQEAIPPLDGELLATPEVLEEHARDLGNLVVGTPSAVLRPGSVDDVAAMVSFCAGRGIPVAARGEKHTMYGQGLAPHGLTIDMRYLRRIHHVDETHADVDAGVVWRDLVEQAAAVGARFPALTGYLRLTVGGTLSVGGISPAYKLGAQVDLVDELQIVTGSGHTLWCSHEREPELFLAALAGLGQVGVITRVRLRMTTTPPGVRLHLLDYLAGEDAFAAMRVLCDREQADELYCMVLPGPIYRLFVTEFSAPAPDLLDGLPAPRERQVLDMSYVDYALSNDVMIDAIRADGTWDRLRKPWFDAFLPEEHVASFMTSVVDRMTTADFSPTTRTGSRALGYACRRTPAGSTCATCSAPTPTMTVHMRRSRSGRWNATPRGPGRLARWAGTCTRSAPTGGRRRTGRSTTVRRGARCGSPSFGGTRRVCSRQGWGSVAPGHGPPAARRPGADYPSSRLSRIRCTHIASSGRLFTLPSFW